MSSILINCLRYKVGNKTCLLNYFYRQNISSKFNLEAFQSKRAFFVLSSKCIVDHEHFRNIVLWAALVGMHENATLSHIGVNWRFLLAFL